IARGIGSTGMPAFGPTHRPEEIWGLVAFVRHLSALTPEERAALGGKEAGRGHEAPHAGTQAQGPAAQAQAQAQGGASGRVHAISMSAFKFVPPTIEVH